MKMNKISVFTPVHKLNLDVLTQLYNSLRAQSIQDFEWILLLNGDATSEYSTVKAIYSPDPRVSVFCSEVTNNIGALKGECCSLATGNIFLEVDYDDMLTPNALEEVLLAFSDPNIQYVYSNCVEFKGDYSEGVSNVYSSAYGWVTREYENHTQLVAFPPLAHYMRRIEWAPNHLRAFKKSGYNQVGGYNRDLPVGDDHELICRFYVEFGSAGFKHIDKCLYLYRVHEGNTCNGSNRNQEIQLQTDKNYIKFAEKMYLKWARDTNLLALDLGGRFNCPKGYQSVDLLDADIIMDLNGTWNLPDNSVGVLRAYHIIEHLPDTIHFFNEAYRVLAPGGFLLIEVPSTSGAGAFSDPTHVKFFNTRSFEYYTNQEISKYIQPQYTGRFQKSRVVEYWWDESVSVISAHLIALKGWYDSRWCGLKQM